MSYSLTNTIPFNSTCITSEINNLVLLKDIASKRKSDIIESDINEIKDDYLKDFPFIKRALSKKELILHGLWHDIGSGTLETLDPLSMNFIKI